MIFTDLTMGESVFLDANTLLYHFTNESQYGPACTEFLERIEHQELVGFTATHVVSEVAHRLMQAHGLTNLASNDSDFDRVPGITRYGPV